MKITFYGAAGTVTGSKFLLEGSHKFLVDCGLFQGKKEDRLKNWNPPPFDPAKLSGVLLTHAHLDHSGYAPILVKRGFNGRIHSTEATSDLCSILLPDAGHLQEEDAYFANKHKFSKHHPALPLYTELEARATQRFFQTHAMNEPFKASEDLEVTFHPAGHILGASIIEVLMSPGKRRLFFSGDLGRPHSPFMIKPFKITEADYLVVESTYGRRLHDKEDAAERLETIINETLEKGGMILIPSFAVERAQEVIYLLRTLKEKKRIPDLPIFVNSPMAINATEVFRHFPTQHKISLKMLTDHDTNPLECGNLHFVRDAKESKQLNRAHAPMIIIAGSGMAEGGRILHHFKYRLGDARNSVIFVGYQAEGTRGRALIEGTDHVKIHGEVFPVKARIEHMESLSAHSDMHETLNWLKFIKKAPRRVFIVHGEKASAENLESEIRNRFGWKTAIPQYGDTFEL